MRRVKVVYKDDDGDLLHTGLTEFDDKIAAFFKGLGFEWTGQGFDLQKKERDISFVKPDEGTEPF